MKDDRQRKDCGRTQEGHRKNMGKDTGRTQEGHRKDIGRTWEEHGKVHGIGGRKSHEGGIGRGMKKE